MIFFATYLDDEERIEYLYDRLMETMEDEDWESVEALITLNPDFMEYELETAYDALPDEHKYAGPYEQEMGLQASG